jgi:hypothetical protein
MSLHHSRSWPVLLILCLALVLSACGGEATPEAEPAAATAAETPPPTPEPQEPAAATSTPTPTPTAVPVVVPPTPQPAASRCQGLAGHLEVQVLVGPAEAVGLEPVAVGNVPFSVTTSEPPYLVEGQAPISYEAMQEHVWGTYAVTMDLETAVAGQCGGEAGSEQLDLALEMTGEQLVVVEAEGFHGEYPWSGAETRELAFPIEEGATAQGEGWAVVLHLGSP